jgi:hypothetical protein
VLNIGPIYADNLADICVSDHFYRIGDHVKDFNCTFAFPLHPKRAQADTAIQY